MVKELKWKYGSGLWDVPWADVQYRTLTLTVRASDEVEYGNIELSETASCRIWIETRYEGDLERGKELAEELLDWWLDRKPLKKSKRKGD